MHRFVLFSASSYFHIFTYSGAAIKVEIDSIILGILVDFCYSGEVKITSNNVEVLLRAASQYSFDEVRKLCMTFLERILLKKPIHCLHYYNVAHAYKFENLEKLALEMACKHFTGLKETDEFLSLDVVPLVNLLKNDNLNCADETIVLKTVMSWVRNDSVERQKHMPELLKNIRFVQMDVKVSN